MHIYIYTTIYTYIVIVEWHEGAPPCSAWQTPGSLPRVSGAPPRASPGTGEGSSLGWTPPWALAEPRARPKLREYCLFILAWQTRGSAGA